MQVFEHPFFKRSLKFKLAMISGCLIIVVVSMLTVATAFNSMIFFKKELNQELTENLRHGVEIFQQFREEIETKLSLWCAQPVLNIFLNNPAMASISQGGVRAYFSKIRYADPWISEILIFDQGKIQYADAGLFDPALLESEQLVRQLSHQAEHGDVHLNVFQKNLDNSLLIISRPFNAGKNEKNPKIISVALDLEQVDSKLFKSYSIGKKGFLTLAAFSQNGDLLISRHRLNKISQISGMEPSPVDSYENSMQMIMKQERIPDSPLVIIGIASLDDIRDTIQRMSLVTVLFGVLACIAGIVGVFILSRYITKPLDHLADEVVSFASGVLEKPESGTISMQRGNQDEIAILAEAFKILFKKIQDYTESLEERVSRRTRELQNTNIQMEKEIEERRRIEDALIAAKEEAENANLAKSEFMARMSHELKTPMNAIIGMAHLCLETKLTLEQEDYLNKIYSASRSLFALISDILDFSRIEAGKIEIITESFRLDHLLAQVSARMSLLAKEKGLAFTCSTSPNAPQILKGDTKRLQQILVHLVSNAVKFTESGEVTISVDQLFKQKDAQVVLIFRVQDTGIGMTENQLNALFQPFAQLDGSSTRKYNGTGLGLIICKRLAELMHGHIQVKSEPGKGSMFCVTIPFDPVEDSTKLENTIAEEMDDEPETASMNIENMPRSEIRHIDLFEGVDLDEARSLFKELAKLLEDDDMEAVEFLEHVNGRLKNSAIRQYLKMIEGHVRRYTFENALAVLERLAEKLNISID